MTARVGDLQRGNPRPNAREKRVGGAAGNRRFVGEERQIPPPLLPWMVDL
jgi:hypothetical protein